MFVGRYTAGAMGAGKSHTIRWLADNGFFTLPNVVKVDPDAFRQELPEWDTYKRSDQETAGSYIQTSCQNRRMSDK